MTYDDIPTHREYQQYFNTWTKLKKCVEGEEAIKEARTTYLPYPVRTDVESQESEEFKAQYEIYLQGAHFVEFTAEAVEDLVSSAFRRPIEVKKKVNKPAEGEAQGVIQEDLGELDYLDLEDIGREIVGGVGTYGRIFMLVDYPTVDTTPNMIEDENNKAYITLYAPLDILNWRETRRSGKAQLVRVVLREIDEVKIAADEDKGEVNEVKYLYRELVVEDGIYKIRIYRDQEPVKTIVPEANGEPLTEIPGMFVGTTSNTSKVDKSPVIGIANSNIKHYQTWAELLFVQTYIGHPQLVLSGLVPGWTKQAERQNLKVKMDASEVLAIEGENSRADILEIEAQNLTHYRTLEVLEASMAEQGARIKAISHKAGVESAQALKIRTSASMSKLASIVNNASQALTQGMHWIALYMGVNEEYTVQINKEFYAPEPDGPFLTSISNAEVAGTAPRGTALNYLKQVELVDDNIPNEKYLKDMKLVTEMTAPMPNKQQGSRTGGAGILPAGNKNKK